MLPRFTEILPTLAVKAEIDPGVTPASSWPVFAWLGEQVGNLQTLGVLAMVGILVFGIVKWVGGASSDNSRGQSSGKIMVFGAIVGGVVIAAAPALIKWATGQNPIE